MNKVRIATALSCAIALWGQSAGAQDQPPAEACLLLLSVSAGTYLDLRQWQEVKQAEGGSFDGSSAFSTVETMVGRSHCSADLWIAMKACIEEGIHAVDVKTSPGREMIGRQCVEKILLPYTR